MQLTLLDRSPMFTDTIAHWYYEQWGANQTDTSEIEIRENIEKYWGRTTPPCMIIAKKSETLIGATELKRHEMSIYPDKEFWIGGVYVCPNHRGQGLATNLVSHAMSLARQARIQYLYLQTPVLDGGIYAKAGFKPQVEVHYNGTHVLVMEAKLF